MRLYTLHDPEENHLICTFDGSQRRSACAGDEGGPLVYNDRLLGIFTGWLPSTLPNIFIHFNSQIMHNLVNLHMNEVRVVR